MDKRIAGVFTAEHDASGANEELKRHGFQTEPVDSDTDMQEAADNSIKNTVDATFNGSGLESRKDTRQNTMDSASGHELSGDRAEHDIHRSGMTGAVVETDELRATDQKDARELAQSTGMMDAMDTLASEDKLSEQERLRGRELER